MKTFIAVFAVAATIVAGLGVTGGAFALSSQGESHVPSEVEVPVPSVSHPTENQGGATQSKAADHVSETAIAHANSNAAFLRDAASTSAASVPSVPSAPSVPEQAQGHVDMENVSPDAVPSVANIPTSVPDPGHGR